MFVWYGILLNMYTPILWIKSLIRFFCINFFIIILFCTHWKKMIWIKLTQSKTQKFIYSMKLYYTHTKNISSNTSNKTDYQAIITFFSFKQVYDFLLQTYINRWWKLKRAVHFFYRMTFSNDFDMIISILSLALFRRNFFKIC